MHTARQISTGFNFFFVTRFHTGKNKLLSGKTTKSRSVTPKKQGAPSMTEDLITTFKGKTLSVHNLPAMPAALLELNKVMADANCNAGRLAAVLSKDQTLALKILKMVNSPIYGFSGRISSLKHAVLLLGGNVLRGMIISTTVFGQDNARLVGLWRHSVACSQASLAIAKTLGYPSPDEYSVAGLLHDVGKLIIWKQIPEAWEEILRIIKEENLDARDAEIKMLGLSHEDVNKMLCGYWNLPGSLCIGMSYHHNPDKAPEDKKMAAVASLADYFTYKYDIRPEAGAKQKEIPPEVYSILALDEKKLQNIDSVVRKTFENNGLITPISSDLWEQNV